MVTDPYAVRDSQLKAFHTAERLARKQLADAESLFVTVQYADEDLDDLLFPDEIRLTKDRSLASALHELAHLKTPTEYAKHGPEFIQRLLELIEYYAGNHVREIYEQAFATQNMLRLVPSYKPSLAFLNYAKNHKGIGRQIVIVYEDDKGRARKVVGEYCGMDIQRKTGKRVAVVRMFGQVSDREIPVKQLRYTFWPRTERK